MLCVQSELGDLLFLSRNQVNKYNIYINDEITACDVRNSILYLKINLITEPHLFWIGYLFVCFLCKFIAFDD